MSTQNMTTLGSQLDRIEAEETSRVIRLMLAHPLLTLASDPTGFDLVRRRRDALIRWFEEHCGWRLIVEARDGYARLLKIRPEIDATRPLRRERSTRAPFDRRRYTLLAIVCAELLATPVTTIGLLADRVAHATAAEPTIETFQTSRRGERATFVDALKLLERSGALRALDGTAESYLDSDTAKVLFQVDTTLLLRLLAAPHAPSTVDLDDLAAGLTALTREPRYGAAPDGGEVADAQRNLWLRHSITRRLLDDPVVYRDDSPTPNSATWPARPGVVWSARRPSRPGSSSRSALRVTCSSIPMGWPPTSGFPTTRHIRRSPRWCCSIIWSQRPARCPTLSWPPTPGLCWNAFPAGPRPTAPRTARPG